MKNSVFKSCFDIILGQCVSYIEASVTGAGITFFVDTVTLGVFLFLCYILVSGDGKITILQICFNV